MTNLDSLENASKCEYCGDIIEGKPYIPWYGPLEDYQFCDIDCHRCALSRQHEEEWYGKDEQE